MNLIPREVSDLIGQASVDMAEFGNKLDRVIELLEEISRTLTKQTP